mmetsp:Transcript_98830/g.235608  ORF Transcript_98830/g.235608 Transcript_98830/m.235608 type:complete len:324 (+) Transcript_98830:322-1293(+)
MVAQPVAQSWRARHRTRCTLAPSSFEGPSSTSKTSPTSKRRTVLDLIEMSSESTVPLTHLKYNRIRSKNVALSNSLAPATETKSRSSGAAGARSFRSSWKLSSSIRPPAPAEASKRASPDWPSALIRARSAATARARSSKVSAWAFLATASLEARAWPRTFSSCTSRIRCCSCKRKTSFLSFGSRSKGGKPCVASSSCREMASSISRTSRPWLSAFSVPALTSSEEAEASRDLSSSETCWSFSFPSSNWAVMTSTISWTLSRWASASRCCSSSAARLVRASASNLAMPTFCRKRRNFSKVTGSSTRMMRLSTSPDSSTPFSLA